jgi:hypothetical protein
VRSPRLYVGQGCGFGILARLVPWAPSCIIFKTHKRDDSGQSLIQPNRLAPVRDYTHQNIDCLHKLKKGSHQSSSCSSTNRRYRRTAPGLDTMEQTRCTLAWVNGDDLKMIVGSSGIVKGTVQVPFRAHHLECLVVNFLSATTGQTTSAGSDTLSLRFLGCRF